MARGQFPHPSDDAIVVGHIAERQEILDRRQIRLLAEQRVAQQPLEFGREGDRPIREAGIMERLHPQPVTRKEQAAAGVIVERVQAGGPAERAGLRSRA